MAAWLSVLAYTSGYLIVFAAVMIAVALLARLPEWWPRARQVLTGLALAAVAAGLAITPVYLPYRRAAREQHMLRSLDVIKDYSATPMGYLASAGRVHFSTWSGRFFKDPVDSFFPGFIVLALAVLAIVLAWRRRPVPGDPLRARIVMLLRDRRGRGRAVAGHRDAGVPVALRTSFRRCRGCAPPRASGTCSCSLWRYSAGSGWRLFFRLTSLRHGDRAAALPGCRQVAGWRSCWSCS